MRKILLALVLVLVCCSSKVFAASITCTWNAPTTRSDSTSLALSEIAAYVLYWDTVTPPLANHIRVPISTTWPSTASMTYTLSGLNFYTLYYVDVAAEDQYGQVSLPSNIVSATTPKPAPPNPPANFLAPTVSVK